MPYVMEWVAPEVAYQIKTPAGEVTIYHAYKDDDADHPLYFWFAFDELGEHVFDVRDVVFRLDRAGLVVEDYDFEQVIREGIERGLLTIPTKV